MDFVRINTHIMVRAIVIYRIESPERFLHVRSEESKKWWVSDGDKHREGCLKCTLLMPPSYGRPEKRV
jgi:hypothetical protein